MDMEGSIPHTPPPWKRLWLIWKIIDSSWFFRIINHDIVKIVNNGERGDKILILEFLRE